MKEIRFYKYFVPMALLVAVLLLSSLVLFRVRANSFHHSGTSLIAPQSDPGAALSQGRTLLKQGHADQALGYLQMALNAYTQAKNPRGIAASEDGLGDLYL